MSATALIRPGRRASLGTLHAIVARDPRRTEHVLRLVVAGDDDPASDCRHLPVRLLRATYAR